MNNFYRNFAQQPEGGGMIQELTAFDLKRDAYNRNEIFQQSNLFLNLNNKSMIFANAAGHPFFSTKPSPTFHNADGDEILLIEEDADTDTFMNADGDYDNDILLIEEEDTYMNADGEEEIVLIEDEDMSDAIFANAGGTTSDARAFFVMLTTPVSIKEFSPRKCKVDISIYDEYKNLIGRLPAGSSVNVRVGASSRLGSAAQIVNVVNQQNLVMSVFEFKASLINAYLA
jgi:hypothetical protein